MTTMQTVSVTEFKADCLEFLNQVAKTGQPVLLTKRGKPTAMILACNRYSLLDLAEHRFVADHL